MDELILLVREALQRRVW